MRIGKSVRLLAVILCTTMLGQLQGTVNADTYEYENGRLKRIIYEDESFVDFTYDKNGNTTSRTFHANETGVVEVTDPYLTKIERRDGISNVLYLKYSEQITKYVIYRKVNAEDTFLSIGETSSEEYKDEDVQAGVSYIYQVKPVFADATNTDTEMSMEVLVEQMEMVSNVSFDISSILGSNIEIGLNDQLTSISLVWDAQEMVSGYEVMEKSPEGVSTIKTAEPFFTGQYLTDQNYTYQVRSYVERENSTVYSAYTQKMSFPVKMPEAPTNVRTARNEAGKKCTFWVTNDDSCNFIIYQSDVEEGPYNFYSIKTNTSVHSCICKEGYFYRVVAYKVVNGKLVFSQFSDYTWV